MVVLIIITMYLPTLFVTVLELVGESSWSHVTVLLECSFQAQASYVAGSPVPLHSPVLG